MSKGDKKRVLVVDDDVLIRQLLRFLLEEDGHVVVAEAGNGVEAVTLGQKLAPDVICLDIRMPVMDGITALGHLKTVCPQATVIMISALATIGEVKAAIAQGANGYILKPFNADRVMETINHCIAEVDRGTARPDNPAGTP